MEKISLSDKMVKALTRQMNREIYSGYLYLGMAAYADSIGLKGFANWFKGQFKEELEHGMRFYEYINSQGARVMLEDIEAPPQDFNSGPELFEKTLAHEKAVTNLIHELVNMAIQENDTDTVNFLQWFVKEQVEEEATPANIIKRIEKEGRDRQGLKRVDEFLGKRK